MLDNSSHHPSTLNLARRLRTRGVLAATALFSLSFGCSEDPALVERASPAQPNGETPMAGGELYAITGTSFGPEGNSAYVALVPSLDEGTAIDYSGVLEIGGGASLFGAETGGFFAVGHEEQPTITRFDVDAEGQFVEGETLSLAAYGHAFMWRDPGLVPFISRDKAYVIAADTLSVVTWNPSSMLVTGSFAIDGVFDADYPDTAFEPDPTRRGDELFVVATHSTETTSAPFSTLIVLDVQNDRVANVVREDRCGGLWSSVQAANGDIYFATGPWDAAQNRVLGTAVASDPCVVRVKAGETSFDPDYFMTASDLTLGRATGGLVRGPNDTAYVKALDESLLAEGDITDFDVVWTAAAWQWWQVGLGSDEPATLVEDIPVSSAGGGELFVEGKAYALNVSADFAETTLFDMSAPSGPQQQLTVRGWPYGIVRVR